jgi:hypothetical protein
MLEDFMRQPLCNILMLSQGLRSMQNDIGRMTHVKSLHCLYTSERHGPSSD